MKPNFALSLNHDGIRLLHRTRQGWMRIGEVALDDPDLDDNLRMLRRTATDLDHGGLATKLIIPNSQVLYTELDVPGPDTAARIAQIRDALIGMTPYDIEELVFDWHPQGRRAQVAVVARETLAEAEAFALEYRFNPVSFVAVPAGATFEGEPFFGPTREAASLLDEGETVERDDTPTVMLPEGRARAQTAEAQAQAEAVTPDAEEGSADGDAAATGGAEDAAEDAPGALADDASAEPGADPVAPPAFRHSASRAADPAGSEADDLPPMPVVAFATHRRDAGSDAADAPDADGPADAGSPPAEEDLPPPMFRADAAARVIEPAPDPMPPVSAPAAPDPFGSDLDDVPDMPAWRRAGVAEAPSVAMTSVDLPGGPDGPRAPHRDVPQSEIVARRPDPPGIPPARVAAPVGGPRPAVSEADAMTVFGARGQAASGAAPRYMGLALTLLLLVALGVTALLSGLLPDDAETASVAPVETEMLAAATPPDAVLPVEEDATPRADPLPAAEIPIGESPVGESPVGESPVADAPVVDDTVTETAAADVPVPLAPVDEAPVAEAPAAPDTEETAGIAPAVETALEEALGGLPTDIVPPEEADTVVAALPDAAVPVETAPLDPPPGRFVQPAPSPAEAEARYAATGIWQLDPDPLKDPAGGGDLLDAVRTASVQSAVVSRRATGLPGTGPLMTDLRPAALIPPAPLGTKFDFDDRGLVRATPDGALTPNGILVVAGPPDVLPPLRPGTAPPAPAAPVAAPIAAPAEASAPAPESADTADTAAPDDGASAAEAAETPIVAETTGPDQPVQIELAALDPGAPAAARPAPGPAAVEETAAAAAPAPVDPERAAELARLAGIRPVLRPGSAAPDRAEPAAPAQGFDNSALALLRPSVRPSDVETAVGDALAEAVAEGVGADLESRTGTETVVAEAETEPDPVPAPTAAERDPDPAPSAAPDLSTATRLAVAASALPALRPQGFGDVVEKARAVAARDTPALSRNDPTPSVAAARAPTIPTRASAARRATEPNAIRLGRINLIGVYGSPTDRRALIRLKSGRYVKVEVGDRIDGGRVAAIGDDELRYIKSGRNITLKMPQG